MAAGGVMDTAAIGIAGRATIARIAENAAANMAITENTAPKAATARNAPKTTSSRRKNRNA